MTEPRVVESEPRILLNTAHFQDPAAAPVAGAVWKLTEHQRDLDSNLIALPAGDGIAMHTGPHLDVLVHVTAGSGQLLTELASLDLEPGCVVWLPRGSRRQFVAGSDGLCYLTVHQRRQALVLEPPAPSTN